MRKGNATKRMKLDIQEEKKRRQKTIKSLKTDRQKERMKGNISQII